MHRLTVSPAILLLALSGCAGGAADSPEPGSPDEATRPPPATPNLPSPAPGGADGSLSPELIDAVIDQAADETGVAVADILVVTAESVTWSDGSLGCPEPGMMYTQALVPGYRVVLDVAGDEIHYHAAQGGEFFVCDNPMAPADSRDR